MVFPNVNGAEEYRGRDPSLPPSVCGGTTRGGGHPRGTVDVEEGVPESLGPPRPVKTEGRG